MQQWTRFCYSMLKIDSIKQFTKQYQFKKFECKDRKYLYTNDLYVYFSGDEMWVSIYVHKLQVYMIEVKSETFEVILQ